jgi:hypothetical protein
MKAIASKIAASFRAMGIAFPPRFFFCTAR